jgi:hypothetical protein
MRNVRMTAVQKLTMHSAAAAATNHSNPLVCQRQPDRLVNHKQALKAIVMAIAQRRT